MSRGVLLRRPPDHWWCPNCSLTDTTPPPPPGAAATRFHPCPGLKGLTAPMVPAGVRAKVEAVEREDYVGAEMVQTDSEGRPIMRIETTRDDGNDVAVLAPCATAGGRAEGTRV